jgi:hypothetical protein
MARTKETQFKLQICLRSSGHFEKSILQKSTDPWFVGLSRMGNKRQAVDIPKKSKNNAHLVHDPQRYLFRSGDVTGDECSLSYPKEQNVSENCHTQQSNSRSSAAMRHGWER